MAGSGILYKMFNSLGNYRSILTNRFTVIAYQQQNASLRTETKENLKRLKIPESPKRPLSPYFRFLNDHRTQVQKQHPNFKLTDIIKQCAQEWKNIDPAIKGKYQHEYDKDMETFQVVHHQYLKSLTEEQSDALTMAKQEKRDSKKKRAIKKVYRETGKPKRPIGSFLYFVKEKWALPENKSKKLGELLSVVKDEWKAMLKPQKEKYVALNEADRKRYEHEMSIWESKMVKEGRTDIIRKESQIESSKPSHPKKPAQKKPR